MQGLNFQSLKKHKALIPLYVCVGAGCVMATLFSIRTALRNPDVQWNRTGTMCNEDWRDKQFKLFSPTMDYKDIKTEAPKF